MTDVSRVVWRKSSRSGGASSNCVEVATWRKSSRSGGQSSNCVEVALNLTNVVGVRDSKNPTGPILEVHPEAFAAFTATLKTGHLTT
jgi:uncharacterized protein DUF397